MLGGNKGGRLDVRYLFDTTLFGIGSTFNISTLYSKKRKFNIDN